MTKTGSQPGAAKPDITDFEERLNNYIKGVQTIQSAMDRLRELDKKLLQHSEWLEEMDTDKLD